MPKPSVGRIVHYHNVTHENGKPFAAIITEVPEGANEDNEATLTVFTPEGGRFATTVRENPNDDVREWWCWPPRVE